jgi:hypothetical protein
MNRTRLYRAHWPFETPLKRQKPLNICQSTEVYNQLLRDNQRLDNADDVKLVTGQDNKRTTNKNTEALLGASAGTEVNIARTKCVVTSREQYHNTDTGKATSENTAKFKILKRH